MAGNGIRLGIKGVYWNKKRDKFETQIKVKGKSIFLGRFNVLGDADSAYRIAKAKFLGWHNGGRVETLCVIGSNISPLDSHTVQGV